MRNFRKWDSLNFDKVLTEKNIFISSSICENINDVIVMADELGINIEINRLADPVILDGNIDAHLKEYKSALNGYKGRLSLHGTFFDLNPVSKDHKIVELTEHRYNQSFKIAKELGIKTVVFHTGYNALVKLPVYYEKFVENQITFWKEFIKRFEDEGITVVLENTYEDTPEIIIKILDNVNSPYLKACIDTGHVNINSPLGITEWIDSYGSRLYHMHLHNNHADYDEHRSLLDGTLEFDKILNYIEEKGLNPNLTIEIFTQSPAVESAKFVKEYLNGRG